MAFLYVYSPSDFVGGLPNEFNAAAAGSPTFTLTLVAGATPTVIEIDDNDGILQEVGDAQPLVSSVNIDGTTYAAGTSVHAAYDLINTGTGHIVTSIHFGGDGYQQGAVDGLVSNIPLEAGTSYTFNVERSSFRQNNPIDEYVACFTSHTRIETKRGMVNAEDLVVGDMIRTLDNGFQPLRVKLSRHVTNTELLNKPKLRPVRISAGSLGLGLPQRDLLVSPQHRFLANSPIVMRMFDAPEALVSAKKMTALNGIYVCDDADSVTYYHLVLDTHEVIFAEGAPAESYYCGPMALKSLSSEAREEMLTLFPDLIDEDFVPDQARPIPKGKLQTSLMMRHDKNAKPLLTHNFTLGC